MDYKNKKNTHSSIHYMHVCCFPLKGKANGTSFIGGINIQYPANFTPPVLGTRPDEVLHEIFAARNQTGLDKVGFFLVVS